jgi:glycosyltransferase involved in cell wall biosynthesis
MVREHVTVLIPVLDEERTIPELGRRLPDVLEPLGVGWSVIFIDDGSRDGTLSAIRALHERDSRFTAISLSRNFGKEIAIAAGLRAATGDACIIMDADLQHPPEVLASFITRWREGYDIVYGQRLDRATDGPIYRFFAKRFYRLFNFLVHSDIPEGAGDFRLLNRRAIDAMNTLTETARFNKGLYSWIGFKSIGVPYTVANRLHGTTRWNLRKLVHYAIDGVTSFTTLPLRVWSLLGVAISTIALIYSIIVLSRTLLYGVDAPGYPTIIISVMFFAGAQLISLGILGEYLGRVYEEVKARPLYIVADRIGLKPEEEATATPPEPPDRLVPPARRPARLQSLPSRRRPRSRTTTL